MKEMKPKWVCLNCGMWSSRKFSVKRHIFNKHYGNANLVSYIDYLIGRQMGLYLPSSPPNYEYKRRTPLDIFTEELWKEKARIAARENRNF
jgi:hypothetical protein